MEWSLLTSGLRRRRPRPSRSCRDWEVCRDPNRCSVFKKVWLNRASASSARPGEELLQAIRHSDVVSDALSTQGRREEWGKRRAMRGLRVLREVLPVEVCHGVGTVVVVVSERRLTGCGLTGCGVPCLGDQLLRWCA
ncbi:hypothetical protein Taro_003161 [Colocasia esculenta]|uniref:Uncharacterized protein n=1 Tax=Colocasia esculenta TaxID=4460 RepID=A0A843TEP1_COLES|nr:hypothetical protein [Colocasia esculenta]